MGNPMLSRCGTKVRDQLRAQAMCIACNDTSVIVINFQKSKTHAITDTYCRSTGPSTLHACFYMTLYSVLPTSGLHVRKSFRVQGVRYQLENRENQFCPSMIFFLPWNILLKTKSKTKKNCAQRKKHNKKQGKKTVSKGLNHVCVHVWCVWVCVSECPSMIASNIYWMYSCTWNW